MNVSFLIEPMKLAPPTHYLQAQLDGWFPEGLPLLPLCTNGRPAGGEAVWSSPRRPLLLTNLGPWVWD